MQANTPATISTAHALVASSSQYFPTNFDSPTHGRHWSSVADKGVHGSSSRLVSTHLYAVRHCLHYPGEILESTDAGRMPKDHIVLLRHADTPVMLLDRTLFVLGIAKVDMDGMDEAWEWMVMNGLSLWTLMDAKAIPK
jgi:hypothetical protein